MPLEKWPFHVNIYIVNCESSVFSESLLGIRKILRANDKVIEEVTTSGKLAVQAEIEAKIKYCAGGLQILNHSNVTDERSEKTASNKLVWDNYLKIMQRITMCKNDWSTFLLLLFVCMCLRA